MSFRDCLVRLKGVKGGKDRKLFKENLGGVKRHSLKFIIGLISLSLIVEVLNSRNCKGQKKLISLFFKEFIV